jgi:hypothetical protein
MRSPTQLERYAIEACDGVGNSREWWFWNRDPRSLIGHLRVGVTLTEYAELGCYVAIGDAGPAGPERPRRHHPKGKIKQ